MPRIIGKSGTILGTDVGVFVSGTMAPATQPSVALFGGDVVVSGTLYGASNVFVDTSSFVGRLSGTTPNVQAAFQKLDQVQATGYAAGPVSSSLVTFNTSSFTASIGPCKVNLYATSNFEGSLIQYTLSGSSFGVTNNTSNYIVGKYNGGSPALFITTNVLDINESDVVPVYTVIRSGSYMEALSWDSIGSGMLNRLHQRSVKTERFIRESGLSLDEAATRIVDITAGVMWYGAVRLPLSASRSDTNLTRIYYNDGAGQFAASGTTQYTNAYYDDGTGGLHALGSNKYVVNWIYESVADGDINILLSNECNSLAAAAAAPVPSSAPPYVTALCILVGRIIAQEGHTTAAEIDSAFSTEFGFSAVTVHNNLSGLQGGTTNEYYHFTSASHANLTDGKFPNGLSGSLTTLTDGTSYIQAGNMITVTSTSNGPIIVSKDYEPSGQPKGFELRTATSMSFNESSRVFTLSPKSPATTMSIWEYPGVEYMHTGSMFVTMSNTMGVHMIIHQNGVLVDNIGFPSTFTTASVASIYWNSSSNTAVAFGDERHGVTMDWKTHEYLHRTVGTRYASGLTLSRATTGTGAADSDAWITMTGGTIYDEDLDMTIVRTATPVNAFEQELGLYNAGTPAASIPSRIPILYRTGSNGDWEKFSPTTEYVVQPNGAISGSTRINYNTNPGSGWVRSASTTNGIYVASWIFATDDVRHPIIAVMGQREDTTLTNAQTNNTFETLSFGSLPFQEMKILYRLLFRTSTAYANNINAYVADVQDLRSVSNLPASSYVATDHSSLTGLTNPNQHPATAISTNTTNFNGLLTTSETDVQLALDRIDELAANVSGTTFLGDVSIIEQKKLFIGLLSGQVGIYGSGSTLFVGEEMGEPLTLAVYTSDGRMLFTPNESLWGSVPSRITFADYGNMPATKQDVFFHVSGTAGGAVASSRKALFDGDVRISGSLTVGTGSVTITSNDVQFGTFATRVEKSGNDLKFYDVSNPTGKTLSSLTGSGTGGGGADAAAAYVVMTVTSSLANERALAAGTGLSLTDAGAGGNVTLAIKNSVVATVSGTTFTGNVTAPTLDVGDVTMNNDTNIYIYDQDAALTSILRNVDGGVTFGPTGGNVPGDGVTFTAPANTNLHIAPNNKSVVIRSYEQFPTFGTDTFFYVSGTLGDTSATARKAVFGGDVRVSGSLTVGTGSVTITSNDIRFGSSTTRIELSGSDMKLFDSNNTSGRTLSWLSRQTTTIYDIDLGTVAAETITTPTTKTWGGITFVISGSNTTNVTNANGLVITHNSAAGFTSIQAKLDQLGMTDAFQDNWRMWIYVSSIPVATGSNDWYGGACFTTNAGYDPWTTPSLKSFTWVTIARDYTFTNGKVNWCTVGTGGSSGFSGDNTTMSGMNVVALECAGGVFKARAGVWSSGWPTVKSMRLMSTQPMAEGSFDQSVSGTDIVNAAIGFYARSYVSPIPSQATFKRIKLERW